MTYCGFKNDFYTKSEARLIRDKGKTHPSSNEIAKSLCKIQKITPKVYATKR
jgi:hypothetical protein